MGTSGAIKAGKAYVELGVSDKITAGLRRAQAKLRAFGDVIKASGMQLSAYGAAAVAPFVAATKHFSDFGDQIAKAARRTGLSNETLSELAFAAELSGTNVEELEAGVRKMQRTLTEAASGSKTAAEAFAALGLDVARLAQLSPEDQFKVIADRLDQIQDPTRKAALAMEIFGRAGTKLIPLMEGGSAAIEGLQKQARDLGLTIDGETAAKAELLNDTLGALFRVAKQTAFEIGSAVAPAVIRVATATINAVVVVNKWIKEHKAAVVWAGAFAAGVLGAGVALLSTGFAISLIGTAIGGLATAFSLAVVVIKAAGIALGALLSPVGLVVAAVVGIGGYFLYASGIAGNAIDWLVEKFGWLWDRVSYVVSGIRDALAAGDIGAAAKIMWLSMVVAAEWGQAQLEKLWMRVKKFAIDTVIGIADTIAGPMKSLVEAFGGDWNNTVKWMHETWVNFVNDIALLWNEVGAFLQKAWLKLFNLFGTLTDEQLAEAKRLVDEDFQAKQRDIEAERETGIAGPNLVDQLRERSKAIDEALNATGGVSEETRKALDEAKRELDALIQKSREERSDPTGLPRGNRPNPLVDLEDRFQDAVPAAERRISSVGTFNAAAASGLGGGTISLLRKMSLHEQEIANNTKRTVELLRTAGPRFT